MAQLELGASHELNDVNHTCYTIKQYNKELQVILSQI